MLVLGIFLILCLVRYPSYDYIDNFIRDKKLFRHEWVDPSSSSDVERVPSAFLPPPKTPGSLLEMPTKSGRVRKVKLPGKHDAPKMRLPPLDTTEDNNTTDIDSIDEAVRNTEIVDINGSNGHARKHSHRERRGSHNGGSRKTTGRSRISRNGTALSRKRTAGRKPTATVRFNDELILDIGSVGAIR